MNNTNIILKNILIGGIFLIPFTPLIVSSSLFFPFITGKAFYFRIIIEILLALWLILAYRDTSFRPNFWGLKKNWMLIAVTTFVSIIALADIFGENISKSIWSNFERMEGLVTLLHLLAFFAITTTALNSEKLWNRFFQVSLGVSVLIGIYGLVQMFGGLEIHQGSSRLDATLGNATYLAVYALFHTFIAGLFAFKEKVFNWRAGLYGFIAVFNIFIIYGTQTRGALLGLLGGILLTALLVALFEKEKLLLRKIALGVLGGILVLTGLFMVVKDTSFIKNSQTLGRLASISLDETTTKSRFMVWGMSWQGFKEKPLLGWGQENFNLVFNKYYNPQMYQQEPWFDRSHNVFFDWLIAGGILGLLGYLSLFGVAVYLIWRKKNDFSLIERSILSGLLAGYFFQNLFVFDNLVSYLLFFSILGYLSFANGLNHKEEVFPPKKGDEDKMTEYIFTSIIIILTAFSFYFINIKALLTSEALLQGLAPHPKGLNENLQYFQKALDYNAPFGLQETREQLAQTATRLVGSNVSSDIKQSFWESARKEMLMQIDEAPNDARFELFMGSLLNKFKVYDEAVSHLKRALVLSPQKQSVYFELGSVYLNKGEKKKALEILKKSYDLAPQYNEARIIYAIAAIYDRQDKLVEDLLVPVYGTTLLPDDRIISAYVVRGEYHKVVKIWQSKIKKDPNNIQNHLSLAAAYLENKQRTLSIEEIKKAMTLNPQFKKQGEYYIKEIKAGRNP